MYRKRRKIQSYRGTSRGSFGGSFKFIVIAVIALAVVSALITGAVLGKNAEKSGVGSFGRHNLTDFGGVKEPAEDYESLGTLKAAYVISAGVDRQGFKGAVNNADEGNAIAFKTGDGVGNLFFASETAAKIGSGLTAVSTVTASEIAEIISDEGRLAVAYFYSSAFAEEDDAVRIVKAAEETALMSELASEGIDEIVVFGLPDDSDHSKNLKAYMAGLEAACGTANVCVALSNTYLGGTGATRVINATEGYADAYAADLSGLSGDGLASAIERYAYFITNYNMRLIVSAADETVKDETLTLLEAYGIESYLFVD